jgi:FdhD protein
MTDRARRALLAGEAMAGSMSAASTKVIPSNPALADTRAKIRSGGCEVADRELPAATPFLPSWRTVETLKLADDECGDSQELHIVEEVPIAFRYHGFSHAVMMATPDDLEDFAVGFSLTEGAIADLDDISRLEIREAGTGVVIDIALAPAAFHRYLATRRVRAASGHTSCGLCGVEDLRDIRKPSSRVPPAERKITSIDHALSRLRELQPLSRKTRGAHASAWVDCDGEIKLVREDVGRHNALDKLIGACLRQGTSTIDGYCLITSRCSFEMVQKAISADYSTLISAAAPTALAIRTAQAAGLTLLSLDRGSGRYLYTTFNHGAPDRPNKMPQSPGEGPRNVSW